MPQQLAFEWPVGVARGPEDFFVAAPNAEAFALVEAPQTWPDGKLLLTGPEGSGKSHLARIFQTQNDALLLSAGALGAATQHATPAVIVEDLHLLPAQDEVTLFHLHNNLRAAGIPLLLTSAQPATVLSVALPDLASRLQATTTVQIAPPDDALLSALLMKLFADRQIAPKPELIRYLLPRIERSFAAAAAIVAALDHTALQTQRKINRALAAELLDKADAARDS